MRILLVSPYVENNIEISPPHGLACLAAYIKKVFPHIIIDVIDLNILPKSFDILQIEDYQIIGFGFTTPSSSWVYEKTVELKSKLSDEIIVVHGGVHATVMAEVSLKSGADVVIRGEGEVTFTKLISVIQKDIKNYKDKIGSIDGISYIAKNNIIHNQDSEFVETLDDLAWPDWSYFNLSLYNHNLHIKKGFALPIMASRGCPFSCEFCCSPALWKRKLRHRSVGSVISEIKYNIEKFHINNFHFYDDDFLVNSNFVKELCEAIIEENLDINYVIMARSDSINKNQEILKLLKASGCILIEFGIENTEPEILSAMNKNISLDEIKKTARLLKEYEIGAFYLILYCYPGETMAGLYYMNKFMSEIQDTPGLTYGAYLVPYPGSKFETKAESEGILVSDGYTEYLPTEIVFIPNSILAQIPVYTVTLNDTDLDYLTSNFIAGARIYGYEGMRQLINKLYLLIDGNKTVKELVQAFASNTSIEIKQAYRLVYRYINYFSQLGLVKDKDAVYGLQQWYSKLRDN